MKSFFLIEKSYFFQILATSRNSNFEMPMSLGMLGYVFGAYSSRSRDLEGPYTERIASGDRKYSVKVSCFVLHKNIRICVYIAKIHNVGLRNFTKIMP